MKTIIIFFLPVLFLSCIQSTEVKESDRIQPWQENPRYWQYKGEPVLLLGASDDDNLFQWPAEKLIPHLDEIAETGGNYLRNTMSDRDEGNLKAFAKTEDGKYDLTKWNDEYWDRLTYFLSETRKRNMIVQIEIWDRFDHSLDFWTGDAFNPANNINYSYEESGFDKEYSEHPGKNLQPFFFTTPFQQDNSTVFKYQKAFVEKLFSISLDFENVLYCSDNETGAEEAWGIYWAELLKEFAGERKVFITQMWNEKRNMLGEEQLRTIDHPQRYGFIDISQNSWNTGYRNWENSQSVMKYISGNPRPVNSVKIYGRVGENASNPQITQEHAVQTFFRNLMGGYASSRFHRPGGGIGLNEASMNSIRAIRKAESKIKFWDMTPRMDLIGNIKDNMAYLTANEGQSYLVYFPATGKVRLDLSNFPGEFKVSTIDIDRGEWAGDSTMEGGDFVEIESDFEKGCLIVIIK